MRYSLRTLMLGLTISAGLCATFFAVPDIVAAGILIVGALITPGVFAVVIVHDRNYLRAFCIGGFGPAAALACYMATLFPSYMSYLTE